MQRRLAVVTVIALLLVAAIGTSLWRYGGTDPVEGTAAPLPVPPFPPRIASSDAYEQCLSALTDDPDGARVIVVALTKADLQAAPAFKAIEKTTYDAMRDKAAELGKKTAEKAGQLKD